MDRVLEILVKRPTGDEGVTECLIICMNDPGRRNSKLTSSEAESLLVC